MKSRKYVSKNVAILTCLVLCLLCKMEINSLCVYAENSSEYETGTSETGEWIFDDISDEVSGDMNAFDSELSSEAEKVFSEEITEETEYSEEKQMNGQTRVGTYSVPSDWIVVNDLSSEYETVYRQAAFADEENTSTIICGYMDTSYSVLGYEQLREMLTNNLVYQNVQAQISTNASYTAAKDYLYTLISDDSEKEYREIFCYVVGDYRCFCVSVKEKREEAELMRASGMQTPEEVGLSIATGFVWTD